MLRALLARWRDPARAARTLERDVRLLVEGPMATHDAEAIARLREALTERLAELDEITDGLADEVAAERLELRYRALNREARRRSDMDQSTVVTLAIIELRARRLGPAGDAASALVRAAFTGNVTVGRAF